jgi:hypothetical protein
LPGAGEERERPRAIRADPRQEGNGVQAVGNRASGELTASGLAL